MKTQPKQRPIEELIKELIVRGYRGFTTNPVKKLKTDKR